MNETLHAGNGYPAGNGAHLENSAGARRRTPTRAADYAMRRDDAAAETSRSLDLRRAKYLWRFELVRSRQRQLELHVPTPLPENGSNTNDA